MSVHICADVEASGPVPGLYDMISVGLVIIEPGLSRTFYAECAPLHDLYVEDAYKSIGVTREQHLAMPSAEILATAMVDWIEDAMYPAGRAFMVSDNPAFDFAFLSWYLYRFTGRNPLGHSARRIGDFAAGLNRQWSGRQDWKKLRQTRHTHNALDDAMGNAEALMVLFNQNHLKAPWRAK